MTAELGYDAETVRREGTNATERDKRGYGVDDGYGMKGGQGTKDLHSKGEAFPVATRTEFERVRVKWAPREVKARQTRACPPAFVPRFFRTAASPRLRGQADPETLHSTLALLVVSRGEDHDGRWTFVEIVAGGRFDHASLQFDLF